MTCNKGRRATSLSPFWEIRSSRCFEPLQK
nr:MAG TPA: hypothetical protein [Caudoviricetes sp.]